jgi:Protein of unknown function (DUF1579)
MRRIGGSMKTTCIAIAAVVLLSVSDVSAQMTRPAFGPKQQKLSFLIGNFTTRSEIFMSDGHASSDGRMNAHWGLDSLFIFISASEETQAMGRFENFGVLGYDSQKDEYVLSMFNNYGMRPQFTGDFAGDTLVLRSHMETPRGPLDQEIRWFRSGGGIRMLVLNDFGQGNALVVDQTETPVPEK